MMEDNMKNKFIFKLAALAVTLTCVLACAVGVLVACDKRSDDSPQRTHIDIIIKDPQSGEPLEFDDRLTVPVAESNEVARIALKVSGEESYLSDADFASDNMQRHLKLFIEDGTGCYQEQSSWDFWPNEVGTYNILITFNSADEYWHEYDPQYYPNDPQYYSAQFMFVLQLI